MTVATRSKKQKGGSGKGAKGSEGKGTAPRSRVKRAIEEVEQGAQPDNGGAATTTATTTEAQQPTPGAPEQEWFDFKPIERQLNHIMRPEDGVTNGQVDLLILMKIMRLPDVAMRTRALAYVIREREYAKYSGQPAPADVYPTREELIDTLRGAENGTESSERVHAYFNLLQAKVRVEKPRTEERVAALGIEFLESLSAGQERFHGFVHFLQTTFLKVEGPVEACPVPVKDAEFNDILWRNRDSLRDIKAALTPGVYTTHQDLGMAINDVLNEIDVAHERYIILGITIDQAKDMARDERSMGNPIGGLLDLAFLSSIAKSMKKPGGDEENPAGEGNQE